MFYKITGHRIDIVKCLNLYAIRDKKGYFLMVDIFEAIPEIAPHYLSDNIRMDYNLNGDDTGGAGSIIKNFVNSKAVSTMVNPNKKTFRRMDEIMLDIENIQLTSCLKS